jgi:hypothetical protein
MNQTLTCTFAWFVLSGALLAPSAAIASPDDESIMADETSEAEVVEQEANRQTPAEFKEQLMASLGYDEDSLARWQTRFQMELDELTRTFDLTAAQQNKLTLAADEDIRRFVDEIDSTCERCLAQRNDDNAEQWIAAEAEEEAKLQRRINAGLHGANSFYDKTLRSMLGPERYAVRQAIVAERARFYYRALVETTLITMDDAIGFSDAEIAALVKLALEETRPPTTLGESDQWVVLSQLASIPDEKLKALLTPRKWELLNRRLEEQRGMDQVLIRQGVIEPEILSEVPAEE